MDNLTQFVESEQIQELLYAVQSYFKRPLKASEVETLRFWVENCGYSSREIEIAIEKSIENGKKSFPYISKVLESNHEAYLQKKNSKFDFKAMSDAELYTSYITVKGVINECGRHEKSGKVYDLLTTEIANRYFSEKGLIDLEARAKMLTELGII